MPNDPQTPTFALFPVAEAERPSELETLIACDLETCGLDEQGDQILEVHARSGSIIRSKFIPHQMVLSPGGEAVGGSFTATLPLMTDIMRCHPAVVEMHSKNGLLAEAHKLAKEIEKRLSGDGLDLKLRNHFLKADEAMAKMFPALPDGRKWTLLGNSVHFDLRFIRRVFPRFAKNLSHRVLDVSSVRMFCEILGMPYAKDEPAHRATEDVDASINLLHRYVAYARTSGVLGCSNCLSSFVGGDEDLREDGEIRTLP